MEEQLSKKEAEFKTFETRVISQLETDIESIQNLTAKERKEASEKLKAAEQESSTARAELQAAQSELESAREEAAEE